MAGAFGNNITAKVLALIFAMILWLYVTNEQNPPVDISITVPLEVRSVSDSYIVTEVPDSVKVKVRGGRSIIAGLQPQDIKASVDLKGLPEGSHTVKVHALVPVSLELVEITPDRIQVQLDAVASRAMPVEISPTGTAPPGVAVTKIGANPAQVTIKGPRTLIDAVSRVLVPVDISDKTADFTIAGTPLLQDKEGKTVKGLAVVPEQITVAAVLAKGVQKKTVDVKTIIYGELGQGVVLKGVLTNPARIEIAGEPQVLDKIDFIYTEPINIAGISQDTRKEIKLQLREGIAAVRNSVTVQISVGLIQ